jgi:multidrug efflux pump subunit AcrB
MANRISQVSGVGAVRELGLSDWQLPARIQLNLSQLAANDITAGELASALRSDSVNLPLGTLYGKPAGPADTLLDARKLRPILVIPDDPVVFADAVVASRKGQNVRLRDVATFEAGGGDHRTTAWLADRAERRRCLVLAVGCRDYLASNTVTDLLPQLTASLPPSVQMEALDPQDKRSIIGHVLLSGDDSAARGDELFHELQKLILQEPDVELCISIMPTPVELSGGADTADILVRLRDHSALRAEQAIHNLRSRTARLCELSVLMRPGSFPLFRYTLQGAEPGILNTVAPRLLSELMKQSCLRNITTDMMDSRVETKFAVNRDQAAGLGISDAALTDSTSIAIGGLKVNSGVEPTSQPLVLELCPADLSNLSGLLIRAKDGHAVPLSSLGRWTEVRSARAIHRTNQVPSITFSLTLSPGIRRGEAKDLVEKIAREVLPPGVSGSWN